jgi:hypothetical protein
LKSFYLIIFLLFAPVMLYAQNTTSDSLAELYQRIDILTEEIIKLRGEAGNHSPQNQENPFGLGPSAGAVYNNTDAHISIAGYGEMVYQNFSAKNDQNMDAGKQDQLDFLRSIFYVGYHFSESILFNSEIEIEHASTGSGGEVSLEFAYLDFKLNEIFRLRTGMLLLPLGLMNEYHEPPVFLPASRPEVERYLIPSTWRGNGIGLLIASGNGFEGKLYLTEGFDSDGFSASSGVRGGRQKGAKSAIERAAISGRLDYYGIPGGDIGISFYSGNSNQSTSSSADYTTHIISGHSRFSIAGWKLDALYARVIFDNAGQFNETQNLSGVEGIGSAMEGYYFTLGYNLLPLLSDSEMKLSPYIHYEKYNLQSRVPAGFDADPANDRTITAAGINFHPKTNIVFKVEYRDNRNSSDTAVDQVNVAMGYMF